MKRLYVVALALILVGCGGDPPPAAPAVPSPTPSSTAVAAPVMPELAKEDSKEGAVAFVKYYVAVVNHASQTGVVDELVAHTAESCESCNSVIAKVRRTYERGGRIRGGKWRITRAVAAPLKNNRWLVTASCRFTRQHFIESNGATPRTYPPGQENLNFTIDQTGSRKVIRWTRS